MHVLGLLLEREVYILCVVLAVARASVMCMVCCREATNIWGEEGHYIPYVQSEAGAGGPATGRVPEHPAPPAANTRGQ